MTRGVTRDRPGVTCRVTRDRPGPAFCLDGGCRELSSCLCVLIFEILFICLFLAVLGLRCSVGFFLVGGVHAPLVVASLAGSSIAVAHGLSCSCTWDPPRPGVEPALAGRFFTTELPGKPLFLPLFKVPLASAVSELFTCRTVMEEGRSKMPGEGLCLPQTLVPRGAKTTGKGRCWASILEQKISPGTAWLPFLCVWISYYDLELFFLCFFFK